MPRDAPRRLVLLLKRRRMAVHGGWRHTAVARPRRAADIHETLGTRRRRDQAGRDGSRPWTPSMPAEWRFLREQRLWLPSRPFRYGQRLQWDRVSVARVEVEARCRRGRVDTARRASGRCFGLAELGKKLVVVRLGGIHNVPSLQRPLAVQSREGGRSAKLDRVGIQTAR